MNNNLQKCRTYVESSEEYPFLTTNRLVSYDPYGLDAQINDKMLSLIKPATESMMKASNLSVLKNDSKITSEELDKLWRERRILNMITIYEI